MKLDEKYTEIERNNHHLLRKLKDILKGKSSTLGRNTNGKLCHMFIGIKDFI